MLEMKTRSLVGMALAVLMPFGAGLALAGEHPSEHPSEHPQAAHAEQVSKDDIADAVTRYVDEDAALKGGYFLVFDSEAGVPLALQMDKVHRERLSRVGPDVYFVCADFKATNGKVYDLDIFMQGPDAHSLAVTEVTVHKEQGQARYNWFEEDGIWQRKSER